MLTRVDQSFTFTVPFFYFPTVTKDVLKPNMVASSSHLSVSLMQKEAGKVSSTFSASIHLYLEFLFCSDDACVRHGLLSWS